MGFSLPTCMACIKWSYCMLPLLGKMPSQQSIFPKRSYSWKLKIHSFPPLSTTPSESLNCEPTSSVLTGYKWVVLRPCVLVNTLLCVCFLSFPHRFYRSFYVSFYYVSLLFMLVFHEGHGLIGLHYFFLFPYGLAHWLDISFYPTNSLGFCPSFLFLQTQWPLFYSCYVHGPVDCYFCNVGPLGSSTSFLGLS